MSFATVVRGRGCVMKLDQTNSETETSDQTELYYRRPEGGKRLQFRQPPSNLRPGMAWGSPVHPHWNHMTYPFYEFAKIVEGRLYP